MSLSRDEAREVAAVALGLTIAFRFGAGFFQVIDELSAPWTFRSLLSRFLAPVGATMGMLTLGLSLLLVLSPNGSIERRTFTWATALSMIVAILGAISVLNAITTDVDRLISRIAFTSINGIAALVLGAAAWWILKNFDGNR